MECKICGAQNSDNVNFCNVCGARIGEIRNHIHEQQPCNDNGNSVEIIDKADKPKFFGFLGIAAGIFVPIIGWIFACMGLCYAKKYFANTNDIKFKKSANLCIIAIIVSVGFALLWSFIYFNYGR